MLRLPVLLLFTSFSLVLACSSSEPATHDPSQDATPAASNVLPASSSERGASSSAAEILPYRVQETADISYPGTPRMVHRIVLNVEEPPSEGRMQTTAEHIWKSGNQRWKEFTIFMYMPGTNTSGAAYGMAEFTPAGLAEFRLQEFALYGTRWKSLEEEEQQADANWSEAKRKPDVRNYHINVDATKTGPRTLAINAVTDFPDGTKLLLNVGRSYYEKDNPDEYEGEIFSRDLTVQNGKISSIVDVDDSPWYQKKRRLIATFRSAGVATGDITRISPSVEVRVLFSPMRDQSSAVLAVVGQRGEYIKGAGAGRSGNITTFTATRRVRIPFQE